MKILKREIKQHIPSISGSVTPLAAEEDDEDEEAASDVAAAAVASADASSVAASSSGRLLLTAVAIGKEESDVTEEATSTGSQEL